MLNRLAALALLSVAGCFAGEKSWDARTAAAYLDGRAAWWSTWATASRDHATFCVSCHTAVPYALSRPALRGALGENSPGEAELALTANVAKRVSLWNEVGPFYPSSASAPDRTAESRATEAILNALILVSSGGPPESIQAAYRNLWATQIQEGSNRGSFQWLDFHNRPWEADDSRYYGSALAAVAAGMRNESDREKISALSDYLKRDFDRQSLANKTVVLWAASQLPDLLTPHQKLDLIHDLAKVQQADGGWSLTALIGTWKRRDGTELETASDGYATGLVSYAMRRAGVKRSDDSLARALKWLNNNQAPSDGRWIAYSLNKKRDLNSDIGRFMSDAATGYAVMALTAK